jgi:hypothetical protein
MGAPFYKRDAWFMISVLLTHMLLIACVPVQILLLAPHEHAFSGSITAEQWQAHAQAHVLQAQIAAHGEMPLRASAAPTDPAILSNVDCGLSTFFAQFAQLTPFLARLFVFIVGMCILWRLRFESMASAQFQPKPITPPPRKFV